MRPLLIHETGFFRVCANMFVTAAQTNRKADIDDEKRQLLQNVRQEKSHVSEMSVKTSHCKC